MGHLTVAMTDRFRGLGRYARLSTGADADPLHLLRVRPPHRSGRARARADAGAKAQRSDDRTGCRAAATGFGLLSTFSPTLASMPREFPSSPRVVPKLAEGALAALDRGDRAEHDRLVAQASRDLRDCDLIALAQYSMALAAVLVAEASGRPVLTTPDSAVLKLKQLLVN